MITIMHGFSKAIDIICRYEGYKEKATADPVTGGHPYTFGYGSQFHPEFGSRLDKPHPLFDSFIKACINQKKIGAQFKL